MNRKLLHASQFQSGRPSQVWVLQNRPRWWGLTTPKNRLGAFVIWATQHGNSLTLYFVDCFMALYCFAITDHWLFWRSAPSESGVGALRRHKYGLAPAVVQFCSSAYVLLLFYTIYLILIFPCSVTTWVGTDYITQFQAGCHFQWSRSLCWSQVQVMLNLLSL